MSADAELLAEIAAKRAEMPGAPLKAVLGALIADAAATWKKIAKFGTVSALGLLYYRRHFVYGWNEQPFFDKLIGALEMPESLDIDLRGLILHAGLKPSEMPAPHMVRRLRVISGEIPRFLPNPTRGAIAERSQLWELLWRDACGDTAPKISEALTLKSESFWHRWREAGATRDEIAEWRAQEKPLHRNRIWRIRAKAYNDLVAEIEPLLQPTAAAA